MSTVGYGDVFCETVLGRTFLVFFLLVGLVSHALPQLLCFLLSGTFFLLISFMKKLFLIHKKRENLLSREKEEEEEKYDMENKKC